MFELVLQTNLTKSKSKYLNLSGKWTEVRKVTVLWYGCVYTSVRQAPLQDVVFCTSENMTTYKYEPNAALWTVFEQG